MNVPLPPTDPKEVEMDSRPPVADDFASGAAALAAIDSPTELSRFHAVLRNGTQGMRLQQALVTLELESDGLEGLRRHIVLAQVRDISLRNTHHEQPLFRAHLREHLNVPGLSGRADHRVAELVPVDAVVLEADGRIVEKTSAMSVLPPTGTRLYMANDEKLRLFIQGGKGLLACGYLVYPTLFPLALPHNAIGDDGAGEGRHIGIFGPSGAGKTTLEATFMTGWARHQRMGQFVIDHDGDLSALEVGRDDEGKVQFSLARAFAAVGRDPGEVIRVSRGHLKLEHATDLAAALRIEHLFERLGLGPTKRPDAEREVAELLSSLLKDVASFADLSYDDTIDAICEACASVYAVTERSKRETAFIAVAHESGEKERRLRESWQLVQQYASAPVSMRELVEKTLFEGEIVIVNLAGAGTEYDGLVTRRLVQTLLDVAHISYSLKQDSSATELFCGRYTRYRPYFNRYRTAEVNAMAVIDEAHVVASEEDVRSEESVASQLAHAIRRTRKYGLGFCFATQEVSLIARSIYRNLGTFVFAAGLKSSSEIERVKEVLVDETSFKLYRSFPDPKSSKQYKFMISGAAVPFANGAALSLHAFNSQDDFFRANQKLRDPGPIPAPDAPSVRPAVVPPAQGLDELLESA